MKTNRGDRRYALILAAILLVGLALRAAYVVSIYGQPEFSVPIQDAAFHDYWARGLVTGDWARASGREVPPLDRIPFLRPPGYPYFLALVYRVFGLSYIAPRIVQMFLGLLSIFLTWLLGEALFGRSVGLVAAAMAAVYWAPIYFEPELQDVGLVTVLNLAFVLIMVRWSARPTPGRALAGGVVLAAAALTRPNALALVPAVAVWIWWAGRRRLTRGRAWAHAAAFVAAVTVGIAPATLRNAVVAGDPVLISSNGGINLYVGNNELSDGFTAPIPGLQALIGSDHWNWFLYDRIVQGVAREAGRPLKYSEVSAWFTNKARAYIEGHPGRFAELCARRAALFWGPAEVASNTAPDLDKARNPVLRWCPGFPFVLGPAWLGIALVVLERRSRAIAGQAIVLVLLFILVYFLTFVPFLVASRFRAPLLPFLFLFAAYAVCRLADRLRARETRRFAAWLGTGIGLTALSAVPLTSYRSDPAWWHSDRAMTFSVAGRFEEALAECEAALALHPGYPDAETQRASLLTRLGRKEEAVAAYRQILAERPDDVDARVRLATLMIELGHAEEALRDLEKMAAANPEMPDVELEIGNALAHLDRYAEAETALRRSLELHPAQVSGHVLLGFVLARHGAHAEALTEFQEALKIDPGARDAWLNMGISLRALGRIGEAKAAWRQALRIDPHYAPALRELAGDSVR